MGKLINTLIQKFVPSTKKSFLIKYRKPNGSWIEFFIAPSKKHFRFKGSDKVYRLEGIPDIDDTTSQRTFHFVHDISHPIKFNSKVVDLIEVEKSRGSQQMQLLEADQQGFQRATLLFGNKQKDYWLFVLIGVGINIAATVVFGLLIADKLGIRFS